MPTPSQVHVSAPLTNMSLAVIQSETDFICDKVFPVVPVQKKADKYYIYSREYLLLDEAAVRAPSTESAGGDYPLTTGDYSCARVAYHEDIDDEERENADSVIDTDGDHTSSVTRKLLISRERAWANAYYKAGVWTKDYEGGVHGGGKDFVQWSDYTTGHSDPIGDIDTARDYMGSLTGFEPNTLVLSRETFKSLKNHPLIRERVQYTQRAVITLDLLAALFELERVMVLKGIYNSGTGAVPIWSSVATTKSAFLCYAAKNPGKRVPTAGYTYMWTAFAGSNKAGARIKKIRIEEKTTDRIEGEWNLDQKLVAADLGIFFKTAVA